MNKLFDKLKERWGVSSVWQVLLILFIFAITGMSSLYVREFAFDLIGITEQTSTALRVTAWILIVFPAYQALFLFYGFIFGQFEFVWNFEKKSFGRIGGLFKRSEPEVETG